MNKIILITGTTSGIGKAIAMHLHQLGYQVIGTYRTTPKDYPFFQIQLDITNLNSIKSVTQQLEKIDVLINNAGVGYFGAIEEFDIKNIRDEFETNFFGTVQMIQHTLPKMRTQGHGKIINISSMAGLIGMPFQGSYSASKHALEGFTASLRLEVKSFGIEVTNILPGDFKSEFTKNRKSIMIENSVYERHLKQTLAKIEVDENNGSNPEKIAELVARLIQQKRLKPRYLIGSRIEHILMGLRKILPPLVIERLIIQHFR
jgi:short-subunit dehydrogenase